MIMFFYVFSQSLQKRNNTWPGRGRFKPNKQLEQAYERTQMTDLFVVLAQQLAQLSFRLS